MYSNCLFEAIKAKLRDFKHVRIIPLPILLNRNRTHFLWIKDKKIYQYVYDENKKHRNPYFFEGFVKENDFESFEAVILHRPAFYQKDKKTKIKISKKMNFSFYKEAGCLNWATYWPTEECYDFPKENKICSKVLVSDGPSISTRNIEDLKKENTDCLIWKYLSPYTDAWAVLSHERHH